MSVCAVSHTLTDTCNLPKAPSAVQNSAAHSIPFPTTTFTPARTIPTPQHNLYTHDIMSKTYNVVLLPGDGIGPEVVAQAQRVLELVSSKAADFDIKLAPVRTQYPVPGTRYPVPLPPAAWSLNHSPA